MSNPGQPKDELFVAASSGSVAGLRAALCGGFDPNSRWRGQTPLMFAAEGGHSECCDVLVRNGARVDATDSYNCTALHFAAKNGHVAVATVLMQAGARNDIESALGGETACDIARARGPIEMVRAVVFHTASSQPSSPSKIEAPPKQPAFAEQEKKQDDPVRTLNDELVEANQKTAVSQPRLPPPPVADELKASAPRPQRVA